MIYFVPNEENEAIRDALKSIKGTSALGIIECTLARVGIGCEAKFHDDIEEVAGIAYTIYKGGFWDLIKSVYDCGWGDCEEGIDYRDEDKIKDYVRQLAHIKMLEKVEES